MSPEKRTAIYCLAEINQKIKQYNNEISKNIFFLLDKSNEPCTFKTKQCIEINDDARGRYNTKTQIKFKTTMLV